MLRNGRPRFSGVRNVFVKLVCLRLRPSQGHASLPSKVVCVWAHELVCVCLCLCVHVCAREVVYVCMCMWVSLASCLH